MREGRHVICEASCVTRKGRLLTRDPSESLSLLAKEAQSPKPSHDIVERAATEETNTHVTLSFLFFLCVAARKGRAPCSSTHGNSTYTATGLLLRGTGILSCKKSTF